jgi:predicted dienelactone hydrolase
MKWMFFLAAGFALAGGVLGAAAGNVASDPILRGLARTNAFTVLRYDWQDGQRHREVPVTIYFPQLGTARLPMIIFSHGLGSSRDGYDYLGRYWAAHGFVSVHVQHIGSDTGIWADLLTGGGMQEAMQRSVANLHNAINRPLDVSFAITRMLELNRDSRSPFFGRLNPEEIGVAGHSFGAFTTLAIAGQSFPPYEGKTWIFTDPRVKAAVPISASVPADRRNLDATYAGVRIPCLHMTGTRDDSPLGETMAAERRVPFDHCKNSDQYLVTFNGADHMTFAGLDFAEFATASNRNFQRWVCESSTIFWNAYLRGDARSKEWLARDFQRALGTVGKVEVKLK